jgi:hypothetical protein
MRFKKGLVRLAVAAAVLAGTLGFTPATGDAANPTPLMCVLLGGRLDTAGDATTGVTWSLQGRGTCEGDIAPPYLVAVTATGVSSGQGICTGGLLTTDLVLNASVTLQNTVTGGSFTQNQRWRVVVTPGVLAHPFIISGDTVGAGTIFSRIVLQCAPAGNPAATIHWVQPI